jgi:hypothetical protein
VGQRRTALSREQVEAVISAHAPMMQRLGTRRKTVASRREAAAKVRPDLIKAGPTAHVENETLTGALFSHIPTEIIAL